MKRYYFYQPAKERQHQRSTGCIEFELAALYAETQFSTARAKEEAHFSYFDQVSVRVATRNPGIYLFEVETGKDSAMGHWAKKHSELLQAYQERGYLLITEQQYFRLRKLAIALLFKHTEFFNAPAAGESRYAWSNATYDGFWDMELTALNYKYNQKNDDQSWLDKMAEWGHSLNDVIIPEQVRVFIAKPRNGERHFKCYNFKISGNHSPRYSNWEEAFKYVERKSRTDHFQEVTDLQYNRLRKICRHLMQEYCELNITPLLKKQDYTVRVLDTW